MHPRPGQPALLHSSPSQRRGRFRRDRRGASGLEWAFVLVLVAAGLVVVSETNGQVLGSETAALLARILPSTSLELSPAAPPVSGGCQALRPNGMGCPVRVAEGLDGIPRGQAGSPAFLVSAPRQN